MKTKIVEKCPTMTPKFKQYLNDKYGLNKWFVGWQTQHSVMPLAPAYRYLYERSYYEYISTNQQIFDMLKAYSDVDCISSKKLANTIRLAFTMSKGFFVGPPNTILEILFNGGVLSPRDVPFFVPNWIDTSNKISGCYKKNSVHHFWQANRRIVIIEKK